MPAVSIPSWTASYEAAEAAIANLALARIGADFIKTTEEDTPASRQVKSIFSATRDELLRDYEFNFAQRRFLVPVDLEYGYKGAWDYAFSLPSTLSILKILEVDDNVSTLFELYDRYICANVTSKAAGTTLTEASIAYSTGICSVSSVADLENGRPIYFISGTLPTGVQVDTHYWIRDLNESTKSFKIAAYPGGPAVTMTVQNGSSVAVGIPAAVSLKVVVSVVDTALWDSLFKDSFVLRLGSKLAIPLAKRADLAQFLQGEFASIFTLAKGASSKERNVDEGEELWTKR